MQYQSFYMDNFIGGRLTNTEVRNRNKNNLLFRIGKKDSWDFLDRNEGFGKVHTWMTYREENVPGPVTDHFRDDLR